MIISDPMPTLNDPSGLMKHIKVSVSTGQSA